MRLRISIIAAVAFIASVLPAAAQTPTTQCDTLAQPTIAVSTKVPFTVGFCASATVDADGNPTTLTGAKIYVDGAAVKTLTTAPVPIGAPNTGGLSYFEVSGVTTTKAPHTLTASLLDSDGESAQSDPLPFVVIGAPPQKPRGVRVK